MTFDLEKARAVCKTLPKYMNGACPCKEEAEAAKMLIKALPEIRRLQEFRDRVARILKQPLTDCDDLLILGLDARICQLRRQAAEIERLRAEISEQKGMIWKTQQVEKEQYAQIKELKADLEQSERVVEARLDVIDQQAAKIRELEDALRDAIQPGDADKIDTFLRDCMCPDSEGPNECCMCPEDTIEFCDLLKRVRVASQQLQAEGKIGPDADAKPREGLYGKYCISKADGSPVDPNADYFVLRLDTDPVARRAAREYSYVTPDRDLARGLQDSLAKYDPQLKDCMNIQFFGLEKPHCWRITEERKVAIKELSELLTAIGCPSCHYYIQKNYGEDITVLRAMLTEAGGNETC